MVALHRTATSLGGRTLVGALALLGLNASPAAAQQIVVEPYLQLPSPSSMTIRWETDVAADTSVEFGPTDALGQTTTGESWTSLGGTTLHRVTLDGLTAGATVHYVARSGAWSSEVTSFVVPSEDPSAVRMVAVSDMQRDGANPDKYAEIISQGVIPWLSAETGVGLPESLDAMLVPGDLVANGWTYGEWEEQFFDPAAPLMSRVPTYPVPGNHESDTPYFFDYFDLPTNGTAGYEEHWWSADVGRVRVVGLDSNGPYLVDAQLDWLDGVLADSCSDPSIDFLVAQLHHPFKSELWTPGENLWTGAVVTRLEEWTETCGRPSVHLFGHTHGYSRGQSRDHAHLWVNVATAGGAIDYWGEHPQRDYAEFTVTQDDWGFVVLDAEAGADPTLRVRRISRGNRDGVRDNELRDEVLVRTGGAAPETPVALAPSGQESSPQWTTLVGSDYAEGDGDAHAASHWQIATSCAFSELVVDRWVQQRNEYGGVDLNEDVDLTGLFVDSLEGETSYCWRVRYRDAALTWSTWSEPAEFTTARATLTNNLITNPGAENLDYGWAATQGVFEAVESGECGAGIVYSGSRMFAVGGVCNRNGGPVASARQRIGVGIWRSAIDAGLVTARVSGWLASDGHDEPTLQMIFLDPVDDELGRSALFATTDPGWTEVGEELLVPQGTTGIEVRLTGTKGTRNAGDANDSYVDQLSLRLRFWEEEEEEDEEDWDDEGDDGPGAYCDVGPCTWRCSTADPVPPTPLAVALLALLFCSRTSRRGARCKDS